MNELLLARARQGDEAAFEELLAEYKQLIWSCCWKFMGNREDAEDCYVEAAARIWKNLPSYQPGGSLKSWICTVTVNVCRNMLDAQIRRGKERDGFPEQRDHGLRGRAGGRGGGRSG